MKTSSIQSKLKPSPRKVRADDSKVGTKISSAPIKETKSSPKTSQGNPLESRTTLSDEALTSRNDSGSEGRLSLLLGGLASWGGNDSASTEPKIREDIGFQDRPQTEIEGLLPDRGFNRELPPQTNFRPDVGFQ